MIFVGIALMLLGLFIGGETRGDAGFGFMLIGLLVIVVAALV